jgi:hypothetical protein
LLFRKSNAASALKIRFLGHVCEIRFWKQKILFFDFFPFSQINRKIFFASAHTPRPRLPTAQPIDFYNTTQISTGELHNRLDSKTRVVHMVPHCGYARRALSELLQTIPGGTMKVEDNGYLKIASYIVAILLPVVVITGFTIYILPWLLLIAAVIGAIWFYLWQRTTRRSPHPWD